jgi:glutaminyl-peptide cyclotransferase
MKIFRIFLLLLLVLPACSNNKNGENNDNLSSERAATPIINYALLNTYPHDTTSYTEGLLVHNGQLFESTGSPEDMPQTRSLFGTLDTSTGKINKKAELDRNKYFGEGIVFLNDKVYQLTYQTKIGFIYDAKTFKKLGEFSFPGKEGWGMTTDSTSLIMSDSTNILYYLDPLDLKTVKKVQVENEKGPVMKINELEYINNYIYANVYETNLIIKIDPSTGKVIGLIDLSSLANEAKNRYSGSMEMNGIAYDPVSRKIYITGKMWPTLYEIQFAH